MILCLKGLRNSKTKKNKMVFGNQNIPTQNNIWTILPLTI